MMNPKQAARHIVTVLCPNDLRHEQYLQADIVETCVQQCVDDAVAAHQQKREELLVENATLEAEVERLRQALQEIADADGREDETGFRTTKRREQ